MIDIQFVSTYFIISVSIHLFIYIYIYIYIYILPYRNLNSKIYKHLGDLIIIDF